MAAREGWSTQTTNCTKRSNITDTKADKPITGAMNCGKRENGAGITVTVGGMKMDTGGIATGIGMTGTTTGTEV